MPRPSSGSNLSLAAIQSILESRRDELNKLKKKRKDVQRDLDGLDRQIDRIEGGSRGGSGRARNEMSLIEALEKVLRASGKPMKVGDIVEAVKAEGYRSSSDNFRGIVNQTLIKDARFTAPARGTYQMKK